MTRLTPLRPTELDPEQGALYAEIAGGPRASGGHFALTNEHGGLNGPFNAMLLSPAIGTSVQALGAALRYKGGLPDRTREAVILTIAASTQSPFETRSHEAVGRACGLDDDDLVALRTGAFVGADDREKNVITVTKALLEQASLSDELYEEAVSIIGHPTLFETTCLVGYYSMLALQMKVFGVDPS